MKRFHQNLSKKGRTRLRILSALSILGVAAVILVHAAPIPTTNPPTNFPNWWFERDIIPYTGTGTDYLIDYAQSDDYTALNQGQLKHIARSAYDELAANLPTSVMSGTEGLALTTLISGWYENGNLSGNPLTTGTDAFSAANLGQLKYVASLFYDVLGTAGYTAGNGFAPTTWTTGDYPWTDTTTDDDNYAAANLGQAKYLFSFDFSFDADNGGAGDGLPDWWEVLYFGSTASDPNIDFDSDGFTNLEEFLAFTNPNDSSDSPYLEIVSGNGQIGIAGNFLHDAYQLRYVNGRGQSISGATVAFQVTTGIGKLSSTLPNGTETELESLSLTTDSQGNVQVYFKQLSSNSAISNFTATPHTSTQPLNLFARKLLDPTSGLTAFWKFDEFSGTVASDSSSNQFHATLNGAQFVDGDLGNAIALDGIDDYANVTSTVLSSLTGEITIRVRVRLGDIDLDDDGQIDNTFMRIFSTKDFWPAIYGYGLEYNPSQHRLTFCGYHREQYIAFNVDLTDGKWHTISFIFKEIAETNTYQPMLFVNDVEVSGVISDGYSGGPILKPDQVMLPFTTSAYPFYIGRHATSTPSSQFSGTIDELTIYNRALLPEELGILDTAANEDSDFDGLPDAWELQIINASTTDGITNVHDVDPNADFDGDGVINLIECQAGTDPDSPDSDYDGRSDAEEISEGTNPMDTTDYAPVRLAYWQFDNSSFTGTGIQLPTLNEHVSHTAGWTGDTILMTSNPASALRYNAYETGGIANINGRRGSVSLWVNPSWTSTSLGSQGPGAQATLIELGSESVNADIGHWSLHISPEGDQLQFVTQNGGQTVEHLTAPITWKAGVWHHVVLTYSESATEIYIDNTLVASGPGMTVYPNLKTVRRYDLKIGANSNYLHQFQGKFDEIETFNYVFSATDVDSRYQAALTINTDGDSLPDVWEYSFFSGLSESDSGTLPDDDSFTHVQEYQNSTDPTEYDFIAPPTLTLIQGGEQWAASDHYLPLPFVVEIRDHLGAILPNAPVTLSVSQGGGVLAERYESESTTPSLTQRSDPSGRVYVNYKQPSGDNIYSLIIAEAGATSINLEVLAGMVGLWKFEEGASTTAVDYSGNGNAGTLSNSSLWSDAYVGNHGLLLDGVDDSVQILDSSSLNPVSSLSVSLWAMSSNWASTDQTLLSKGTSTQQYKLSVESGLLTFQLNGVGTLTTTTLPTYSDWNHIAATYDGTAMKLFIDGSEVAQQSASGSITVGTDALTLGSRASAPLNALDGRLDQVRLYDRSISAQEIAMLANERSIVGNWQLEDASGTVAVDSSFYSNDATLNNGPTWDVGYDGRTALNFDGTNDTLSVAHPASQELNFDNRSWTIAVWFQSSSTQRQTILAKGDGSYTAGFHLAQEANGTLEFGIGSTSGTAADSVRVQTVDAFNDGLWHYAVAVVHQPAAMVYLYVDGARVDLTQVSGTGGTLQESDTWLDLSSLSSLQASNASDLTLGSLQSTSEFFSGSLDEIVFYRGILTLDNVAQSYSKDSDGDGLPDWWENRYGLDPNDNGTTNQNNGRDGDIDNDLISNWSEWLQGTSPVDYYNGISPTLEIVSGNNQYGVSGEILARPLVVRVKDASGQIMTNAPVNFTLAVGLGNVLTNNLGASWSEPIVSNEDGEVEAWFLLPQVENDSSTIRATAGTTQVDYTAHAVGAELTGGDSHLFIRKFDGTVWGWGNNRFGQLGDGTTTNKTKPIRISSLSNVKKITAAAGHTLALLNDGTVLAWGWNQYGQLGLGDTMDRNTPTAISSLTGVVDIASGCRHSMALLSDGSLRVWGNDSLGQLGTGSGNSLVPTAVSNFAASEIIQIECGRYFSVALTKAGNIYAWGQNNYGQIGNNSTSSTVTTPQLVQGATRILDITAGEDHALAIDEDGTVYSWGRNHWGQLGANSAIQSIAGWSPGSFHRSALPVLGMTNFLSVEAGKHQSFAVDENRELWSWGSNLYSQNRRTNSVSEWHIPATNGLTHVFQTLAGAMYTAVLTTSGEVRIWGKNWYGESALGTETYPALPSDQTDSVVHTVSEIQINATVATPVVYPAQADVIFPVDVSLDCFTSGASIYYTDDGSEPSISSTLYTGPITLSGPTTIKAKAYVATTASAVSELSYVSSSGSPYFEKGLRAEYYNGQFFETQSGIGILNDLVSRWGWMSPDPVINEEFYSSKYTGYLIGPHTGDVTINWYNDDRGQLFLDDQLIFDQARWIGGNSLKSIIPMEQGKLYKIELSAQEGVHTAGFRISWRWNDSVNFVTIPSDHLIYFVDTDEDRLPDAWEADFGLDNTLADEDSNTTADYLDDFDNDTVTNFEEFRFNSDPLSVDSDYDGIDDGTEVSNGTSPSDATEVAQVRLGHWKFDNTNWLGESGQAPLESTALLLDSGWSGNGVTVAGSSHANLRYADVESDNQANINVREGTVRFWYRPSWSSSSAGGSGPGAIARLLEIGEYDDITQDNWWGISISADGNQLLFESQSGGATESLGATISFQQDLWYQIVAVYTGTTRTLYVNAAQSASDTSVTAAHYPNQTARALHGFSIGSDHAGALRAEGSFEELETFNYPMPSTQITSDYSAVQALAGVTVVAPDSNLEQVEQRPIELEAETVFFDKIVSKVEFYVDSIKVGEDTDPTGEWSYSWTASGTGSVDILARATFSDLTTQDSSTVSITILANSDPDDLPDAWETTYGINAEGNDDDHDGDGLSNLEEYRNGTDPTTAHSDTDTMPDNWEIINGLDPNTDDSQGDKDGDGILNYLDGRPNDPDIGGKAIILNPLQGAIEEN